MKSTFLVILVALAGLSLYASQSQPKPPVGKTRLVWATDNNPVRKGQMDLFNKLNPDIEVVIDPMNREQQKVIVQSLGGVGPDVFDTYGALSLENFVRSGVGLDLTEEFRKDGIDAEKIVWPVARPSFIYEGRVYGFPCNVNANAVWFNKKMFDEAGVPYPKSGWTWDDLKATAKKLTKFDANNRPIHFGFHIDFFNSVDVAMQLGATRFNKTGTECVLDSPGNVRALDLIVDLMYKSKVAPSPAQESAMATAGGWSNAGGLQFFIGGKVAMAFGGRWWLNLMRTDPIHKYLGVVELPTLGRRVLSGGARSVMVNAKGKNIPAAIKFVKFLTSDAYNTLLNDQADALAPVMASAYTPRFLKNPEYPSEDFNEIWREAVKMAEPDEITPFAKGSDIAPINTQLDLVKMGLKSPAKAMRDCVQEMNARMRDNAKQKPSLTKLWTELTGAQP